MRGLRLCLCAVALACRPGLGPYAAFAQATFNPRDDQFRTLGLMRAEAEYTRASADVARARQLHARGFLSVQEVETANAQLVRARVDYLQQALSVLSQAAHVSILRAIKHRGPGDRNYVSLTIGDARHTVDLGHARALLGDSSFDALRAGDLAEVYVSIKADAGATGATIALPYETRVEVVRGAPTRTVQFKLLRDVDEVVVSVAHGDKVDERKILLEQDATANLVAIDAGQFSQEADLGAQVAYQLQLTRFARDEKAYQLRVDGLPLDVAYEFRDVDTRARLNQLRFAAGTSRKPLLLVLSLPMRASPAVVVDAPLHFYAEAVEAPDDGAPAAMRSAQGGSPAGPVAGRARLELIPRGIARAELKALNLYQEITTGDSVIVDAVARNAGSRMLRNVRLLVDAPAGWAARVVPSSWTELPVGSESRAGVTFVPPSLVAPGDYEARLRLESGASDRKIDAESRVVRIHVGKAREWFGTAALFGVVLVTLAVVLTLGVRLARR